MRGIIPVPAYGQANGTQLGQDSPSWAYRSAISGPKKTNAIINTIVITVIIIAYSAADWPLSLFNKAFFIFSPFSLISQGQG